MEFDENMLFYIPEHTQTHKAESQSPVGRAEEGTLEPPPGRGSGVLAAAGRGGGGRLPCFLSLQVPPSFAESVISKGVPSQEGLASFEGGVPLG